MPTQLPHDAGATVGSGKSGRFGSCVEPKLMMELHVCNRKGGVLRVFALGEVPEIVIGRDEECDIRIDASSVSREHCSIERVEDDYYIVDLNSTGGTFLDGSRIDRTRLEDGMVVTIGPAILKFFESGV